jgi:hypothetical protein
MEMPMQTIDYQYTYKRKVFCPCLSAMINPKTSNHALYLEPRVKMMQDWADYLERTLKEIKVTHLRDRVA